MVRFVTTQGVRQWANRSESSCALLHLIRQLVLATVDQKKISKVDFPAYESGTRPGFDGEVICSSANPWVPEGRSVWELSKNSKPSSKAQDDFAKRDESSEEECRNTTYVCLTARHWQKKDEWAQQARESGYWKDVRAYDADDIEQWLEQAPGVAAWFAQLTGERPPGVDAVPLPHGQWHLL